MTRSAQHHMDRSPAPDDGDSHVQLRRLETMARSPFAALRQHAARSLAESPVPGTTRIVELLLDDDNVTVLRLALRASLDVQGDRQELARRVRGLASHPVPEIGDLARSVAARMGRARAPGRWTAGFLAGCLVGAALTLLGNSWLTRSTPKAAPGSSVTARPVAPAGWIAASIAPSDPPGRAGASARPGKPQSWLTILSPPELAQIYMSLARYHLERRNADQALYFADKVLVTWPESAEARGLRDRARTALAQK